MIIFNKNLILFVGYGREGDVIQKGCRIVSGISNRYQWRVVGREDE